MTLIRAANVGATSSMPEPEGGSSRRQRSDGRTAPSAGVCLAPFSLRRRILRRIKRELQAAEADAADVEDESDEAGDWLCPLNERDVAPLLGPAGVESVIVSQRVLSQRGPKKQEVIFPPILSESDESQAAFNPAAAVKAWRHGFLDLTLDAYLKLLDWNARRLVSGKSGAMDPSLPPILVRLGLTASGLGEMVENFERWFHGAVGSPQRMAEEAARQGRQWLQGINHARAGFS